MKHYVLIDIKLWFQLIEEEGALNIHVPLTNENANTTNMRTHGHSDKINVVILFFLKAAKCGIYLIDVSLCNWLVGLRPIRIEFFQSNVSGS